MKSEKSANKKIAGPTKKIPHGHATQTFPHMSAAKKWASVFGKTTIDAKSADYKLIIAVGECLIEEGYGIVHGGYSGGAMAAVSEGANTAIRYLGLSQKLNVGVPHVLFDKEVARVRNASFTKTAKDIYGRLQIVASGNIAVVCPRGGIGTQLELTMVLHENATKRSFGQPVQPLIFVQTNTGENWKQLFAHMSKTLRVSTEDVYFVRTISQFQKILQNLKIVS